MDLNLDSGVPVKHIHCIGYLWPQSFICSFWDHSISALLSKWLATGKRLVVEWYLGRRVPLNNGSTFNLSAEIIYHFCFQCLRPFGHYLCQLVSTCIWPMSIEQNIEFGTQILFLVKHIWDTNVLGLGGNSWPYRGCLWPFSVSSHFGVILRTCPKMTCNSKTAGCRLK